MIHFLRFRTARLLALLALSGANQRIAAQEHEHHAPHKEPTELRGVGTVSLPNSGAAKSQAAFLRGVALLHSFEYDETADAFGQARSIDPAFALAYWMEALTYRHALWDEENLDAARAVLAKLGSDAATRLARAHTPRERAYGAAVEALFADAAANVRARAFADSMRSIARAHPDDLEAAAFASLGIQSALTYLPRADQDTARDAAITLGERVFHANPKHPGAAHYLIHAYDDPSRAARGVVMARTYARIAPASEHALHMPSHIFVQLGLWDDVASSNEAAWSATRAWVARRKLGPERLDFHALHWLHYAYVQQGRFHAARALDSTARQLHAGLRGVVSDTIYDSEIYYEPAMRAVSAATLAGDWRSIPDVHPALGPSDHDVVPPETFWLGRYPVYYRGVTRALSGDTASANRIARSLRSAGDTVRRKGWFRFAALQLDALVARSAGDTASAIVLLDSSAALQEKLASSGPPLDLSSREMLGATLLAAGRPQEAAVAYKRALIRTPNRAEVLLGLARSLKAAGDASGAVAAYRQLLTNWKHADRDLVFLREVREGAKAVRTS